MKRSGPIPTGLVLALVLCAVTMSGQGSDPAAGANAASTETQGSTDSSGTAQADADVSQEQPQYVPALNGAGLFSLEKIQSIHILAGGAVSGGMDTNPNNSPGGQPSAMYSFLPYIGVAAGNARTQFLLQYRPIFTKNTAYAGSSLQEASVSLTNRASPRLNWTVGMNATHGDSSVRLLAPSHSVAVGSVAGSGSSAAAYLPNAGVVTYINGAFDLLYDLSPRDALAVQIANSFNSYSQSHQSGGVATETVTYSHAMRRTLEILVYQQTFQYYLDLHCTTLGGGFGVAWQPRAGAKLSVQGGPQLNSPGCNEQQGFAYHAYFSSNITGKSQFYLRGDREAVNGFLGPGLWQNDVSGGYQREFSIRNSVGADLGYLQSSTLKSSTLANSEDYAGFFAEASYVHQIKGPLSFSCRYQNLVGRQGTSHYTRNLMLFSIVFTPEAPSLPN
jgi:hypothetical protein